MNNDIAMQWADDLEANQDLQGKGTLKTKDGKYCCLGRLCVILGHDPKDWQKILPLDIMHKVEMRSQTGEWLGLSTLKLKSGLAAANDSGATFPEIAAFIRERWEAL